MPIILIKQTEMKKIFFVVAIVLGMVLASSCGNQKKNVAEGEAVEAVDSVAVDSVAVEVPADSLTVVAE